MNGYCQFAAFAATLLILSGIGSAAAEERPFEIDVELGSAWQAKNDVQVPGDTGTRFALDDVVGSGPWVTGRVTFNWNVSGRHGLRLLAAPLGYEVYNFAWFNSAVANLRLTF